LAFRLMPFKVPGARQGFVNSDIMYENMMTKFHWRELDNPGTYYDDNFKRFVLNLRGSFFQLANQLIREGKEDKAKKALLFVLEKTPDEAIPYDIYAPQLIDLLFQVGEEKRASEILGKVIDRSQDALAFFTSGRSKNTTNRMGINIATLTGGIEILFKEGKEKEGMEQAIKICNRADEALKKLINDRRLPLSDTRVKVNLSLLKEIVNIFQMQGKQDEAQKYNAILEDHLNRASS
ncbi:MAG: hypothetical protein AAFU64_07480, partial [Bacteroidota bacterium]